MEAIYGTGVQPNGKEVIPHSWSVVSAVSSNSFYTIFQDVSGFSMYLFEISSIFLMSSELELVLTNARIAMTNAAIVKADSIKIKKPLGRLVIQ